MQPDRPRVPGAPAVHATRYIRTRAAPGRAPGHRRRARPTRRRAQAPTAARRRSAPIDRCQRMRDAGSPRHSRRAPRARRRREGRSERSATRAHDFSVMCVDERSLVSGVGDDRAQRVGHPPATRHSEPQRTGRPLLLSCSVLSSFGCMAPARRSVLTPGGVPPTRQCWSACAGTMGSGLHPIHPLRRSTVVVLTNAGTQSGSLR